MFTYSLKAINAKYITLFGIGLCLVLLTVWIPLEPKLQTFILFWRVETVASLFLIITLSFFLYKHSSDFLRLKIHPSEIKFIIVPLLIFVLWSGVSMLWAEFWKPALYHTLIWTEYLIFYLIIRHILNLENGFKIIMLLLAVVFSIITLPAVIEYSSFLVLGGATTLGIRFAKYGEQVNALLPLFIVVTLRFNGKRFIVGLIFITIMWLFIISTLSRINLALCLVGIVGVVFSVLIFKRFRRYRQKSAILVLIIVSATVIIHSLSFFSEKPAVPIVARVNDEAGISSSNNFRKLMTSISLEIIKTHPSIGIGADNYGFRFNNFREIYAAKNPTDDNLVNAENEIAERSHNEYLQITAELGAIGALIFFWLLCGIGIMIVSAFKKLDRLPFLSLAALLGIILFLISSAVSSYSFRLVQNGFIFFFVLAIAAKFLPKSTATKKTDKILVTANCLKAVYMTGIIACLILAFYCISRAASVYYALKVGELTSLEKALPLYEKSFWLDELNADAHFDLAVNLLNAKRYNESAAEFRKSIDIGRAPSSSYSYLSTAQFLAGDTVSAEQTFAEALRLYPFSPFVRTRYAFFLQINGKNLEAEQQLEIARQMNKKQANTWWSLINSGVQTTTNTAFQNDNFAPVMDLIPNDSLSAIMLEREIRFPTEKLKFDFLN